MRSALLQLVRISKSYPGVQALRQVDFDLREGEVHFLLGENGAGKSTLMKILSGSVEKDSGKTVIGGGEVEIHDPVDAQRHGIAMVYQELSLLPALSVAENIFAGMLPVRKGTGIVDWPRLYAQTRAILKQVGLNVAPQKLVRELGVSDRQLVEIAKALSRKARILLLDEPTSALSTEEAERLFAIIKGLQEKGISIIYVSHRLAEVPRIAQRVTVLRDGQKVGTLPLGQADEAKLISMMVGREIKEQFPKEEVRPGEAALEVEGLSLRHRLKDVGFTVRRGEIVGVFGLRGAGRTSLARALFGLEKPDRGTVRVEGRVVTLRSPQDAIRAGIGYVTEDRRMGLAPRMGVAPNITLPSLKRLVRGGFVSLARERELARRQVEELRIHTPHLYQLVEFLSGGNQQKVVVARWICSNARILLLDEPTRGIDVGAKVEVYRLMGRLAREGAALLLLSSELPEVMAVSDRILVMAGGEIVAAFHRGEATPDEIMYYGAGGGRARV